MAKKKKAAKKKAAKPRKAEALEAAKKLIGDYLPEYSDARAGKAAETMRRLAMGLGEAAGVKKITFVYNGEGDSGDMEDIIYEPAPKFEIPEQIRQQLENCAWEFIPSGFENNEGGFGNVVVDIENGKIRVEHSERVIETIDSEQEYEF